MVLNSLYFIYVFFPIFLIIYYVVPSRAKLYVMLAASIIFYIWGGAFGLLYIGISVGFNYLSGLELGILTGEGRYSTARGVLIASVAADLFLLVFFKYSQGTVPVGISFYTFSVLSYLFDVYRGRTKVQYNPFKFAVYVMLFVKVVSGPVVQYADIEKQLDNVNVSWDDLRAGMQKFLAGLMKKVIIADRMGAAFGEISASGSLSCASAWLSILFFSLQLYFDFSGYSDMAIGLARMLGFRFDDNFNYPYVSASPAEFWRRWHISLGEWFKQYVYFPLGGSRRGDLRTVINILIVWFLTGVWHGSTLNFILWGLYNGGLVLASKFIFRGVNIKFPAWFCRIITVTAICIGWIFFFSPTVGGSFIHIGRLFGIGVSSAVDATAASFLSNNAVILAAAIIGCGSIVKRVYKNLFYKNVLGINTKAINIISMALTCAGLLLATAGLVSGTFSSFLYAQF